MAFICFTAHPTEGWSANTIYTVLNSTLPDAYKPKSTTIAAGVDGSGDFTDTQFCAFLAEDTTGNIKIATKEKSTTGYFSCNMCYPIHG